jgi:hypothetical protein
MTLTGDNYISYFWWSESVFQYEIVFIWINTCPGGTDILCIVASLISCESFLKGLKNNKECLESLGESDKILTHFKDDYYVESCILSNLESQSRVFLLSLQLRITRSSMIVMICDHLG